VIKSLATNSKFVPGPVASVKMLGSDQKIRWNRNESGMVIKKLSKLPAWQVIGFKIEFKEEMK